MILDALRKKLLDELPAITAVDSPRPPVQITPDNVTFAPRELPQITAPQVVSDVSPQLPVITQPNIEGKGLPVITGLPAQEIQLPQITAPTVSDAPTLPTIGAPKEVPTTPNLPVIAPVSESQRIAAEQNALNAKDYSIKKDESGNIIHRGKDRDKQWSTLEKFGNAARGYLNSGISGAIEGATNRNYNEQLDDARRRAELAQAYKMASTAESDQLGSQYKKAQIDNVYQDNLHQQNENVRKTNDRFSRERTARMNAVAGMFKNLPAYDPNDPKFAEMTEALGDAKLPITPKDSKKKVDLKQDQRTGAWTVILTDPLSGKQEVRPVMEDGKQLKTTPTVVMQGEYGMLRQDDQQAFTASENEKNRALRRQQIEIAKRSVNNAIDNYNLAVQKFNRGDVDSKAEVDRLKIALAKSKQDIMNDSTLTAEEKAELLSGLPVLE